MRTFRAFAVGITIVLALLFGVYACNANLCGAKGGHLAISLLSQAGYACVDPDGRVVPIP